MCRFGGHCITFYSVAQHSVHVSKLVPPHLAFQALMHDAAEAYIGDMVRPLKKNMPEFQAAEDRLWETIALKFGLPRELDPLVKTADNVALMTERRDIVIHTSHKWGVTEAPHAGLVIPLPPGEARLVFLFHFLRLTRPEPVAKPYLTPLQEVVI